MGSDQRYHKITAMKCLCQSATPPKLPQNTSCLQPARLCHWLAILRISHSEQECNALIELLPSARRRAE